MLTATQRAAVKKQYNKALRDIQKVIKPMLRRQARLTENDPELRDLRNQLIASCEQVGRIGGKDKYTDRTSLHGLLLKRTKKGNKPRAVGIDYSALGLSRKEAIKEFGSPSVKAIVNSSVEFTWMPCTDTGDRNNGDGVNYKGRYFSANGGQQRIVIPFKTYQRFFRYIDLDKGKRSGIIPPGNNDHWVKVASSIDSFNGTHGVEQFTSFIRNYITPISGDTGTSLRPMHTVIVISNVKYFNLNNQHATPIEDVPFGRFATDVSHACIDHVINVSDKWDDNFIVQPPVPKGLEGFEAFCVLEPILGRVKDSAFLRKKGNTPVAKGKTMYKFEVQPLIDIMYNRPKDGPIFVPAKTTVDKTGKVRHFKRTPIFIPPEHPDYVDAKKLPDLRTKLKDAERIFDFFSLIVVVYDEHENELWRYPKTPYDTEPEWCQRIDLVARDGHLYLCASRNENPKKIGSLHQAVKPFREPIRCSNKFLTRKPKQEADVLRILVDNDDYRTIPDLIARTVSTTEKSIVHIYLPSREVPSQLGKKFKRYENDLEALFFLLRHEKQFQTEIFSIRDRSFGLLKLRRFTRNGHPVVVNIQALSPTITSIEDQDALMNARDTLHRRIFTRTALSFLNKYGLQWFSTRPGLGGLVGSLCPDIKGATQYYTRVWEIDIKSQHPHALSQIKFIACYSIFDYPEVYNREQYIKDYGHAVEIYTSYYVDFYVANHLFQDHGMCCGMELLHYKPSDYKITHYFRPSKVIPSHVFLELARFHETTDLPQHVAKLATMPICGEAGKQFNKNSHQTYFTDKETAFHYKDMYAGSIIFTHEVDGCEYFVVSRELQTLLTENFRPLYFQEWGVSKVQQFFNIKKIAEKAIVLQTKTDAVFFALPENANLSRAVMDRQKEGRWWPVPYAGDDEAVPPIYQKEVMGYLGMADQMVDKTLPYSKQKGGLKLQSISVKDVTGNGTPKYNIFDRYKPTNKAPLILEPFVNDGILFSNFPKFSKGVDGMYEGRKAGAGTRYKEIPRFTPTIVPVNVTRYTLPDEFDVEGSVRFVRELLDKYPRLCILAEEPGAGKSSLTKAIANSYKAEDPTAKVLTIAQYWETAQEFSDIGEFKSNYSAYAVAFGGESLKFTDENGKVKNNSHKKGENFGDYKVINADEIFTSDDVSLHNMQEKLFDLHPKMIVISNGDVGQLPPVNTDAVNNIPEHLRRARATGIIDRMFPVQIVLRQVKRARCAKHATQGTPQEIRDCPDCQKKRKAYVDRNNAIRGSKDGPDAFDKMKTMFKTIDKLTDFKRVGITSAVAYQNPCCDVVNKVIHTTEAEKAGYPGQPYYPGMFLIAKKCMRLGQEDHIHDEVVEEGVPEMEPEEEEDEDEEPATKAKAKPKVRIYTNHMYRVDRVSKDFLTLSDQNDSSATFTVKRVKKEGAYYAQIDHFLLPYCRTGHSFQGKNVNEKLCIMEGDFEYVTKEWLLVAATRNIDPDSVYIYVGDDYKKYVKEAADWRLEEMAKRELDFHMRSDKHEFGSAEDGEGEGNRYPTPKEYITLLKKAVYGGKKCPHPQCQNTIGLDHGRHSWDRGNGRVRHWISNCKFVCSLSCNSSMRPSMKLT